MRYKVIYKIIMIMMLILLMIYSCFQISTQINNGYRNEIELFYESQPMYDAVCYYKDDKFIYVCSPKVSTVQIFLQDGSFLKGIFLPSMGGHIWIGTSVTKELYVYCVRNDYQLIIDEDRLNVEKNIQYINPEEFYKKNNIINGNLCTTKGNYVKFNRNNTEYSIKLNTQREYFTSDLCVLLIILCINGILILTGAFKKILNEAVNNIDKRKDPYAKLKRK